jgi:hypothetical protein
VGLECESVFISVVTVINTFAVVEFSCLYFTLSFSLSVCILLV